MAVYIDSQFWFLADMAQYIPQSLPNNPIIRRPTDACLFAPSLRHADVKIIILITSHYNDQENITKLVRGLTDSSGFK
jgi:hypothetical protein